MLKLKALSPIALLFASQLVQAAPPTTTQADTIAGVVATNAGIEVFSPEGAALGLIKLPHKPQNLAFAGFDKKTLYIVGRGAVYKIATLTPGYLGRAK